MIRAAILGCGSISRAHLTAYNKLAAEGFPLKLVACCDIRPEQMDDDFGDINRYTELDEMLANEKNADYIDICVPTFLHAEFAIKCMKAGFNVLSEKPMALNGEQADRMLACAKETGKTLMIAHVMRFFEPIRIIREYIEDQPLGKPQSAFFTRIDGRPSGRWNNWMCDSEKSGGCILDLSIHDIDIVNWIFGMPKAVSAAASRRDEGMDYQSVCATSIYEGDLFVNNYTDWAVENNHYLNRSVRVNFEHGYIFHERGERNILVAVDDKGNTTDLSVRKTMDADFFRNELEYYANMLIWDRRNRICKPEHSAEAVKIIMAQRRSADLNGAPVYLDKNGEIIEG